MIIEVVNKKKPKQEKVTVEVNANGEEVEVKLDENKPEEKEVVEEKKEPIDENRAIVRYKPYEPDAKAMPDGERWSVRCDGKWYLFKKQRDAVRFARLVAEDRGVDVAVHAPKKED
ncbi:MAG: hypothetical protein K6B65_04275 [Bacilli bacterium]|nr:hypothetical protein [Bacilli bacterium]